jgi:asparagine synthase (glutamine-hydrolysing)
MCGIAGAVAFGAQSGPISRDVILRLNALQHRRGPDGEGLWAADDNRVVLGHRRLAIIDTGSGGAQPMSDASGRWIITFNGEIYNYRELRLELERAGRVFRSSSDTEVLINAMAHWGEAGLRKLRGMYAFALWDKQERELWLARDPYGIKPLYVSETLGTVWFASQARPLSSAAPVDTRRDPAAVSGFYLWGYVPEPFAWWRGIQMFPAGHVQRIRMGQKPVEPKAFARVQDEYLNRPRQVLAPGELCQLLLDSVRHHMVADVPVGVFLSAGIDSNVVAALASQVGSHLRTLTLAFDEYADTQSDEAPLAEAAARVLQSEHNTVRIGRDEFEALLDDFLGCMDQPTIDGLNTYLVSRAAAAQGLKVALSGLGGDELFAGYPSFRQIPRLLKWGERISFFKPMGSAAQALLRVVPLPGVPPKAPGLLSHANDIASAYLLRRALHLEDELDALLDEGWLNEGLERLSTVRTLKNTVSYLAAAGLPTHAQVAALESCWYMRNQLLRDTDWSSMAHGLEVRLPLVDMRVLERLGPAIASEAPPNKEELAACAEHLPRASVARPKTGFTTPLREWIGLGAGNSMRGLRGWAADVHRYFRVSAQPRSANASALAAE